MIPVNRPLFISNEKKYLDKCITSGWISSEGSFVAEFENSFSKYIGKKYGTAVSSGTAALEVAMGVIELKPGDEVIMPAFTIISCALAVVNYGGVPVLVDCEPDTWNMDPAKIEEKITPKTKAIMVVHIYGHPCDMNSILKIAKKHKLLVVEDSAEAHGAEYKGKKCGSFGDISCFSFYANKIINTGEGGMVLTNNEKYAKRAKFLRNLAFDKERKFIHKELAKNYRMTNMQAAVGVAQLKNIEKLVKIKRENGQLYTKLLKNVKGLQLPIEKDYAKNVYWMYGIVLDKTTKYNAESFAKKLAEKGVQTRFFFNPLHLQPVFSHLPKISCPVAEKLAEQGLYLPSGLGLKKSEIKVVCDIIRKLLNK